MDDHDVAVAGPIEIDFDSFRAAIEGQLDPGQGVLWPDDLIAAMPDVERFGNGMGRDPGEREETENQIASKRACGCMDMSSRMERIGTCQRL